MKRKVKITVEFTVDEDAAVLHFDSRPTDETIADDMTTLINDCSVSGRMYNKEDINIQAVVRQFDHDF